MIDLLLYHTLYKPGGFVWLTENLCVISFQESCDSAVQRDQQNEKENGEFCLHMGLKGSDSNHFKFY